MDHIQNGDGIGKTAWRGLDELRRDLISQVAGRVDALEASGNCLDPAPLVKTYHGIETLRDALSSARANGHSNHAQEPTTPNWYSEIAELARRSPAFVELARDLANSGNTNLIIAVLVNATSLTAASRHLLPLGSRSLREAHRRRLAQSLRGEK
jgi:hypothetical protein